MGFFTGLIGGATLTLSFAYIAALSHSRNRRHQAALLSVQTHKIESFLTLTPFRIHSARPHSALRSRQSFVETLKSRWNEEVINAVEELQQKDWTATREEGEALISGILHGVWKTREDRPAAEQRQPEIGQVENTGMPLEVKSTVTKDHLSTVNRSDVERALQRRYRQNDNLSKSIEETLEKRYT
ncbi:hypothetical protein K3495_g80 [Podosphaera aphanis]|nr:hypothetical protein K3495_g80 [Podosphaera aphanis]